MSFKVTKSNICIIGMVVGIGLIASLPLLHRLGVFAYGLLWPIKMFFFFPFRLSFLLLFQLCQSVSMQPQDTRTLIRKCPQIIPELKGIMWYCVLSWNNLYMYLWSKLRKILYEIPITCHNPSLVSILIYLDVSGSMANRMLVNMIFLGVIIGHV